MAWTAPSTWVATATLTAAQMNTQVRDNMNALREPEMVLVGRTANLTIGNSSWTGVSWDTEVYDTHGAHDNVTSNDRLDAVTDDVIVQVFATVGWADDATGERGIRIKRNSDIWAADVRDAPTDGTLGGPLTVSCFVPMSAASGHYLTCEVYQSSGGNLAAVYSAPMRFGYVAVGHY